MLSNIKSRFKKMDKIDTEVNSVSPVYNLPVESN